MFWVTNIEDLASIGTGGVMVKNLEMFWAMTHESCQYRSSCCRI